METTITSNDTAMRRDYLFLHAIFFLYSLGGVFSKLTSTEKFLSPRFFLYYGIVLLVLIVYAILWQQILRRMPLTTAFAHKSVVIIWGFIWGNVVLRELITFRMVLGSIIILIGLLMVVFPND